MESENIGLHPPYSPTANLKAIFDTWRDRSMPEQVTKEWLERVGISTHLTTRNLHALRFLGLTTEGDYTTEIAQRLRIASSEDYPSVLEGIVRKAYRKVFETRNPSTDSRTRIEDAFRHEQPQAQRSRMVACFLGLCALAGIPLKEAPPVRDSSSARKVGAKKPVGGGAIFIPAPPTRVELVNAAETLNLPKAEAQNHKLGGVLSGLLSTVLSLETVEELDEWYLVFKPAFGYVKNKEAKNKSEAGLPSEPR